MAYKARSLNSPTSQRTLARRMVERSGCTPDREVEFKTPRRIKAQMRKALGLNRLPASPDSISVYRQHIERRLTRLCARCRGKGSFVTCGACHRRHWQMDGLLEDLGVLISEIGAQSLARLREEAEKLRRDNEERDTLLRGLRDRLRSKRNEGWEATRRSCLPKSANQAGGHTHSSFIPTE